MRIYLSYAHIPADAQLTNFLAAGLRAAGVDVWFDREPLSGRVFDESNEEVIRASDHPVCLVSPQWLNRDWTRWEVDGFMRTHDQSQARVFGAAR